jgi:Holliday junction resolvasome RuvABC endonuclease subunit
MSVILAIDPAKNCGWACSTGAYGSWFLGAKPLSMLHFHMSKVVERFGVGLIVFERVGIMSRNLRTQEQLTALIGIIRLVAEQHDCRIESIHASSVKWWATGNGHADKAAMIAAARERFASGVVNDDQADAVLMLGYALAGFPRASKPTARKQRKRSSNPQRSLWQAGQSRSSVAKGKHD